MLALLILLFALLPTSSATSEDLNCDPDEDLHTSCLDDANTDCPSLVQRGLCLGEAIVDFNTSPDNWSAPFYDTVVANVLCPQSCARYHRERNVSSLFVRAVSGMLEDHHVDVFGGRHEVCDLRRGWTHAARRELFMNSVNAYASFNEERIARYTEVGFRKDRLRSEVWEEVQRFYRGAVYSQELRTTEGVNGWTSIIVDSSESKVNHSATYLTSFMDESTKDAVIKTLQPLAEEWSGVKLEFTLMFGIRRYLRDARLMAHVDRRSTHVVSAIVNVGQDGMEEPWPLQILDHQGKVHSVILEPGDLLWYESAK